MAIESQSIPATIVKASQITGRLTKSQVEGTANKIWRFNGIGNDPYECTIIDEIFVASDTIHNYNDVEKLSTNTIYVKMKEIKLNEDLPAVRIFFDLRTNVANALVYGTIYKNGIAIGTEQSTNSTTVVTFNQDFTGFVANDLIQIYLKIEAGGGQAAYATNFRLAYDIKLDILMGQRLETLVVLVNTISITNQDPA